ncbi:STAS domain-containing protein [Streptomyces sp. NPDC057403]|uniref:STAS domain-containing protein n=1 Tax=Streptomyces sp. NPDC057403 TaxID=3346119 RepID=UPI0036A010C5
MLRPRAERGEETKKHPGAGADTVIDLRGVTFIDGSGLNALPRTADRLHACRHDLTIVVTNPFHR